jgi:hypothetical protein
MGRLTMNTGSGTTASFLKKEPYFLPIVLGFGHGENKVRIDAMPGLDIDVHATKNRRFHIRALREPDTKEVVPQVKVGGQSL